MNTYVKYKKYHMKIVALDGYAANPGDLSWDEMKTLGECTVYDRTAPSELLERAKEADILLTNKVVITGEHMAALPRLKYIGVMATGYNIVDTAAAKERGIIVTNIPAYSTDSVAQMVFAHLLNIAQQVQHHSEEVHKGRWTNSPDFCFWDTPLIELAGKKIGIVGLGNTGMRTARIAISFGMEVHAYTSKSHFQLPPEIKKMELDELFAECDIVSLHIPANAQTKESINYALLSRMKKGAILVNTARKEVINEADLKKVLEEREDLKYYSDLKVSDHEGFVGTFGMRYFAPPKKMGAQTSEANINAGIAAARQIEAFLKTGDTTFQVNK